MLVATHYNTYSFIYTIILCTIVNLLYNITINYDIYVQSFKVNKCNALIGLNNHNILFSRQCAECIVEYDDLDKVSIDNPKDYKPMELRNMSIDDLEKTITETRRIVRKMELVRKNNPMEFVKSNYNIVRKLLARSLFIRHEIELNRRRGKLNKDKDMGNTTH